VFGTLYDTVDVRFCQRELALAQGEKPRIPVASREIADIVHVSLQ
jgi:hypothetical protein